MNYQENMKNIKTNYFTMFPDEIINLKIVRPMIQQLLRVITIPVLTSILLSGCAIINRSMSDNYTYIYFCKGTMQYYSPSDSTEFSIIPFFQQDKTIISLIEDGTLTYSSLWHLGRFYYEWHEIPALGRKTIKLPDDDCNSAVPDSNRKILELVHSAAEKDSVGNIIYKFGVSINYNTGEYCFELKKINNEKYMLKMTGIIL